MVSRNEIQYAPFPETNWSVVKKAARSEHASLEESEAALAELCRAYWLPIYAFLRKNRYNTHDAEDLTQEFLALLLAKNLLAKADPNLGKLRSYLLGILKKFLSDVQKHSNAQKRGSGARPVSIDSEFAESRLATSMSVALTPEEAYELQWVLTVLETTVTRMRDDYRSKGKGRLFEILAPCLQGGPSIPHRDAAEKLGMSESALKVAVHRLRLRYRESIRSEIAATLGRDGNVDEELLHLQAALHR